MATADEIDRRVEEVDVARSAKRSTVAKQVSELAQRRIALVEQLDDVERELGDVLVDAQDVIGVNELAGFTDLKAGDLTQWLTGRKATRVKRRKPATVSSRAHSDATLTSAGSGTPPASQAHGASEPAAKAAGSSDVAGRVAART